MNVVGEFTRGEQAMLDGEAYRTHFPDDPAYALPPSIELPRLANYTALLRALADLEREFRIILSQNESPSGS